MQTERADVLRRSQGAQRGLVLGLLAVAVSACTGCGQPRSFLDTTVMLQQSRDADFFWGPDGLAGQAPLASRTPDPAQSQAAGASAMLAQAHSAGGRFDLFPATYRSARLPRSTAPVPDGRAIVLAPPSPPRTEPRPAALVSAAYETARIEAPKVSETAEKTVKYVTGRPRDDGLMLTSLDESESLPPLPETNGPQSQPGLQNGSPQDSDALPPLPPGME
ncbi:MAG: hypothetical protein P4L84_30055 [Isosphaeraceae bacterium]|nr:hypothetical protein [Isosphaeraceae bacterium]